MASPITKDHGTILEDNVRQVAARLGVADFVFTAEEVTKGTALREAGGDGLLISNGLGAVLQVKSREPAAALTDEVSRVESWLGKNAFRARDQGRGTKRELKRLYDLGNPLKAYPIRAMHLPDSKRERYVHYVSGDTSDWPTIVVLDHIQAIGVDLGFEDDTLWITYDDWCALQLRVRSTTGILRYVRRVLLSKLHVPLGKELERYTTLREAFVPNSPTAVPEFPDVTYVGDIGAEIFHEIIDKVWHDDGVIPWSNPEQYRAIVEFLDNVPPSLQTIVGSWFFKKRSELASGQARSSGIVQVNNNRLVYLCTNITSDSDAREWQAQFSALTILRHTQAIESGALTDSMTLGVAALVETRGSKSGVSYIYVLLRGSDALVPIPTDIRRFYEYNYGIYSNQKRAISELRVTRNELCPCMSGKKYKKCCGN